MEPILLFLQNIGAGGLAVIVIIALLFFGGKKIPELMKGLGKGLKEFKNAKKDIGDQIDDKEEK